MLICPTVTTSIHNFELHFWEAKPPSLSFHIINYCKFSNIEYPYPIPLFTLPPSCSYYSLFYEYKKNACQVIQLKMSSSDTKYITNKNQY